jgi:menaquinone-dependent protoporphyrinogen oxidase
VDEPCPVRVLVAVASRHGATAEIAAAVADGLRTALPSAEVAVRPAAEVDDVAGLDAVVVGSAVYFGHWLEDARELLLRCAVPLWDLPVWIFSSGPVGVPPRPPEVFLDVDEVRRLSRAREHRLFPGRLDPELLDLAERAMVTALRAPAGDFRDLTAARGWGAAIGAELAGMVAAAQVSTS